MNPTSADALHALGLTQGAQMHHSMLPHVLQTAEPLKRLGGVFLAGFSIPSPPHGHHWHLHPPGFNGEQEAIWPCAALCSHQCCVCFFISGVQTVLIYVNWNCTGRFFSPLHVPLHPAVKSSWLYNLLQQPAAHWNNKSLSMQSMLTS